ncbi:MAG: apolipoprotein A1/A4/E family protein [Clostridiaceae bacterium]|jgi:hypothetical protein|nr:apolipoprotein A1/A4/E family protein [Clostridiaceae bacterium]
MNIFMHMDGSAELVSPVNIYQGNDVAEITVFTPLPLSTALQIAFRLSNGVETQHFPMIHGDSVTRNGFTLNTYTFRLHRAVTEFAGTVNVSLVAIVSVPLDVINNEGNLITVDSPRGLPSALIAFEVQPSIYYVPPDSLPDDINELWGRLLAVYQKLSADLYNDIHAAGTGLDARLTEEATAREAADTEEATVREAADTEEATTRAEAVGGLQASLEAVEAVNAEQDERLEALESKTAGVLLIDVIADPDNSGWLIKKYSNGTTGGIEVGGGGGAGGGSGTAHPPLEFSAANFVLQGDGTYELGFTSEQTGFLSSRYLANLDEARINEGGATAGYDSRTDAIFKGSDGSILIYGITMPFKGRVVFGGGAGGSADLTDVVRYYAEDDKRIILDNNKGLQGTDTDGAVHNLAELSQWGVADFGSEAVPFNINSAVRPTAQIGTESGSNAEELAFLSDISGGGDAGDVTKEWLENDVLGYPMHIDPISLVLDMSSAEDVASDYVHVDFIWNNTSVANDSVFVGQTMTAPGYYDNATFIQRYPTDASLIVESGQQFTITGNMLFLGSEFAQEDIDTAVNNFKLQYALDEYAPTEPEPEDDTAPMYVKMVDLPAGMDSINLLDLVITANGVEHAILDTVSDIMDGVNVAYGETDNKSGIAYFSVFINLNPITFTVTPGTLFLVMQPASNGEPLPNLDYLVVNLSAQGFDAATIKAQIDSIRGALDGEVHAPSPPIYFYATDSGTYQIGMLGNGLPIYQAYRYLTASDFGDSGFRGTIKFLNINERTTTYNTGDLNAFIDLVRNVDRQTIEIDVRFVGSAGGVQLEFVKEYRPDFKDGEIKFLTDKGLTSYEAYDLRKVPIKIKANVNTDTITNWDDNNQNGSLIVVHPLLYFYNTGGVPDLIKGAYNTIASNSGGLTSDQMYQNLGVHLDADEEVVTGGITLRFPNAPIQQTQFDIEIYLNLGR